MNKKHIFLIQIKFKYSRDLKLQTFASLPARGQIQATARE